MTTTNHNLMLRQGDVLIVAVDKLPDGLTEIPRKARGLVLADGKATGHAHAIASAAAKLFTDAESVRYLRAVESVELLHEEHKTVCSICARDVALAKSIAIAYHEPSRSYRCAEHARRLDRLQTPGATVIAAGDYRVTIHAEYVPGELPRTVED